MYLLTVTSMSDDTLVSCGVISAAEAQRIMGNLHVSRLDEIGCMLIVETTGGVFRYFFDCFR